MNPKIVDVVSKFTADNPQVEMGNALMFARAIAEIVAAEMVGDDIFYGTPFPDASHFHMANGYNKRILEEEITKKAILKSFDE